MAHQDFAGLLGGALKFLAKGVIQGAVVAVIMAPTLFLGILLLFATAWASTILWGWFLVPMGLPPATVVQAFGILLLIRLARGVTPSKPKADGDPPAWRAMVNTSATTLLYCAISLLSGWLVHRWGAPWEWPAFAWVF